MKRLSEAERILECLICPIHEQCERENWAEQERETETGSCKFFVEAGYEIISAYNGCSFGFTVANKKEKQQ